MNKLLVCLLVCLIAIMSTAAFAQAPTRPSNLELVEKIDLAPQSKEEAVGGRKVEHKVTSPETLGKDGALRVSPTGAPAFYVRNERREGIAKRTDGPELKGQAPTWSALSW